MPDNSQKDFSKIVKVKIAKDKMKVFLVVNEPDSDQSKSITPQYIYNAIDEAGVKSTINQDIIQEIIDKKQWGKSFVVAEGKCPIHGKDGKLEFSFRTEKSFKPKMRVDGHVDYKEVSVIHSVEKDAVLVKKVPATLGSKGMDVLGNELPPVHGKNIEPIPGQETYEDPEDSSLIRATTDGIVFYNPRNHRIEVQQLYVVQDSVDYSTGNVHVKSSVEIRGDVRPGFSVTTPYNIEIKGVVENATITCDGTLKVQTGITGDGKQLIEVGGDVHSGYINNQLLKSGGSVYAYTEIRNANIESNDEVTVINNNGVIVGGQITAINKISAAFIGNENFIPTVVQVGVNLKLKEELLSKEAEKAAVEKQIDHARNKATVIIQEYPKEIQNLHLKPLQKKWKEYSEQLERLKKEIAELEEVYDMPEDPVVWVSKRIYPGTLIKIKDAEYEVKNELSGGTFRLVDDKITLIYPAEKGE